MKYKIYIIIFTIITILPCVSQDSLDRDDPFDGVWAVDADEYQIKSFLIIKKIESSYFIIRIGVDGSDNDVLLKGFGNKVDHNKIIAELRGRKYTLKWDKDGENEWIEMYINPDAEDYPYFERIENFSIDKF